MATLIESEVRNLASEEGERCVSIIRRGYKPRLLLLGKLMANYLRRSVLCISPIPHRVAVYWRL